jgi:hypothetical protein
VGQLEPQTLKDVPQLRSQLDRLSGAAAQLPPQLVEQKREATWYPGVEQLEPHSW